jgi:UDP-glucose:(heptosyl)LPS alpha-1,3-glucosyltransferase
MRAALVLEHFDPLRGGLEQWTWQFARRLIARGHEVHAAAFDFPPEVADSGIIAHRVPEEKSRIANAAALEREVRALDVDVVHDMGCGWHADIFHPHGGSLRAHFGHNLLRIPRWRRITFWRERRYREMEEIERRQLASGALIVCVSEMVRRHFTAHGGVAPERLRVIRNGVDAARFSPEKCRSLRAEMRERLGLGGHTAFLLVAHNLQLKNASAAIRAAARLPDARLVIVGSRKMERARRLARKLGVDVQFIGPVADALPYYAAADVCLHPTWYDPCSLVTIEAMGCGLPVITTRFNGAAEMMTDETRGFVLDDPADVEALAGRMRALCNPAERSRTGEALRRAVETHSLERQTDEFLALYEEVIRRRG